MADGNVLGYGITSAKNNLGTGHGGSVMPDHRIAGLPGGLTADGHVITASFHKDIRGKGQIPGGRDEGKAFAVLESALGYGGDRCGQMHLPQAAALEEGLGCNAGNTRRDADLRQAGAAVEAAGGDLRQALGQCDFRQTPQRKGWCRR